MLGRSALATLRMRRGCCSGPTAAPPGSVSGGELTHLTGNLYLLRADAPIVTMERKEK